MVMQNPRPDEDPTFPGAAEPGSPTEDGLTEASSPEDIERHERIEAGIDALREQVSEAHRTLRRIAAELNADDEPLIDVGHSFTDTLTESIERQPLTAVVLAALVGFVVGSVNAHHTGA